MKSRDRFEPSEDKLRAVPIGNGLELILDRATAKELGMKLPMRGWKFRISRVPLKKKRAWLKSL
jgi:hypothetical protein